MSGSCNYMAPDRSQVEGYGEFDDAAQLSIGYCRMMSEEAYEKQAETETEKALKSLIQHLQTNPDNYLRAMKKRKQEEMENSSVMSYLKIKMMSLWMGAKYDGCDLSLEEKEKKLKEIQEGMSQAFNYSQESKGRRCSKRLAAKRKQKPITNENKTPPPVLKSEPRTPAPPPPPPLPMGTPQGKRTPLGDRNSQMNTPQSIMICKKLKRTGSTVSFSSLVSVHDELLKTDPSKRLRSTKSIKSPGGTPLTRRRLRQRTSSGSLENISSPSGPLQQAFANILRQKFMNARTPSPAQGMLFDNVTSPASEYSPVSFTP